MLQLLGDIARAMGPAFDKAARPVLLYPAAGAFQDNKKQVGCPSGVNQDVGDRFVFGLPVCQALSSPLLSRLPHRFRLCPLVFQVRDGLVYLLDAWISIASADKVFPAVADALANPKCLADGRVAGLQW